MKLLYTAKFKQNRGTTVELTADSKEELLEKLHETMGIPRSQKVILNRQVEVGEDPAMDVLEIRRMTELNQKEFAERYELNERTLRTWERGERDCSRHVRQLLYFRVLQDLEDGLL